MRKYQQRASSSDLVFDVQLPEGTDPALVPSLKRAVVRHRDWMALQ